MSQKSSSLAYEMLSESPWEEISQDFVPELSLVVNKRSNTSRGESPKSHVTVIMGSLSVSF